MNKLYYALLVILIFGGNIYAQFPDATDNITPFTTWIRVNQDYKVPTQKHLYILNIYSDSPASHILDWTYIISAGQK